MALSFVVPLDGRWVGERGEGSQSSWTGLLPLAVEKGCNQPCSSEKPKSLDLALQGLCSSSHACQGRAHSPHTPSFCLQPRRQRRYRSDSAL